MNMRIAQIGMVCAVLVLAGCGIKDDPLPVPNLVDQQ